MENCKRPEKTGAKQKTRNTHQRYTDKAGARPPCQPGGCRFRFWCRAVAQALWRRDRNQIPNTVKTCWMYSSATGWWTYFRISPRRVSLIQMLSRSLLSLSVRDEFTLQEWECWGSWCSKYGYRSHTIHQEALLIETGFQLAYDHFHNWAAFERGLSAPVSTQQQHMSMTLSSKK